VTKKLYTILGIIVLLGIIGSAIAGTLYHFDKYKVDKKVHDEFVIATKKEHKTKVDKEEYKKFTASTNVQFLEQHRRYISQRLMVLRTDYPNTYHTLREYNELLQELKQLDMKINAYYQRGGK
jgi:hypothetical protein